mmetsp:Transcript_13733/g.29511  ORF Transcript_13733/g.29511 Transcript_13733/m.29511 type:complete len:270 (+) Transcript_13733:976-1785(+)
MPLIGRQRSFEHVPRPLLVPQPRLAQPHRQQQLRRVPAMPQSPFQRLLGLRRVIVHVELYHGEGVRQKRHVFAPPRVGIVVVVVALVVEQRQAPSQDGASLLHLPERQVQLGQPVVHRRSVGAVGLDPVLVQSLRPVGVPLPPFQVPERVVRRPVLGIDQQRLVQELPHHGDVGPPPTVLRAAQLEHGVRDERRRRRLEVEARAVQFPRGRDVPHPLLDVSRGLQQRVIRGVHGHSPPQYALGLAQIVGFGFELGPRVEEPAVLDEELG